MILGFHVVFGAYGFWLPNDPRGSNSEYVGSRTLYDVAGEATTASGRASVAAKPHDRAARRAAKDHLLRPPVRFTGVQARAVGEGFAQYVAESGLKVWAAAIMPDHFHIVTGRFRCSIEQVVIQLKAAATRALIEQGLHPFADPAGMIGTPPKCFGQGCRRVYLNSPADVLRSVGYVEENPEKSGFPRQHWKFVSACPYRDE